MIRNIIKSGLLFSRSGRIKRLYPKILFIGFLSPLIIILGIIVGLSLYTPLILYKEIVPGLNIHMRTWFPNPIKFLSSNFPQILQNNQAAIINTLLTEEPSKNHFLPTVKLLVQKNTMERLDHEMLLHEWGLLKNKTRLKGQFEGTDEALYPVSFGIRGLMKQHHLIWKPSLRLKFKKTFLLDGFRNIVLIAPEDGIGFRNGLSSELSQRWGMLNYQETFARLFINNKYMGLYNRLRRLNESLLIHSGKLPGPFFRVKPTVNLESWLTKDSWTAYGPQIKGFYSLIGNIISAAENVIGRKRIRGGKNRFNIDLTFCPGTPTNVVQSWLERNALEQYASGWPGMPPWPCQKGPSATPHIILNELIDREIFAKYLALLTHAGETHVDDRHNNAFWLDPVSGKLNPLLEDVNGYDFPSRETQQLRRPIIKRDGAFVTAWQKNPKNFALYISRLYELLHSFGSAESLEVWIRSKWKQVRSAAVSDLNSSKASQNGRSLISVNRLDQNVENLIQFIQSRNDWIEKQISEDKISIISQSEDGFEIYIEGFAGVSVKKRNQSSLDSLIEKTFPILLIPSVSMIVGDLLSLPPSYSFYRLSGKPNDYVFIHRLTGKTLNFSSPPEHLDILRVTAGINSLQISEPDITPILIGPGKVLLHETREYNVGQPVTILPGTKLKLGPGVSLILRGPLHVKGTNEQPVLIHSLDPREPFGVVALLGKETAGSSVRHLDIEGGSVHRRYNLNFTGMFSVHNCPDIEIHESRFGQNFIGDDAVHILGSNVKIINSSFENNFLDAMDWDQVDGKVIGTRFINPGNDGLDLSMGNVHVANSHFEHCGDKCLSAGEGVRAVITGSRFIRGKIGIAVKDRSHVELKNNLFSSNLIAYNSYRKKWRWEKGGEGVIENTQFLDSVKADLAGDKYSWVKFITRLPEDLRVEGKLAITQSLKE